VDEIALHDEPLRKNFQMDDHIYKKLELVGTSKTSSDDAIRNALKKASETIHDISWFEVIEHRGDVKDGEVVHFQVTIKAGFHIHK